MVVTSAHIALRAVPFTKSFFYTAFLVEDFAGSFQGSVFSFLTSDTRDEVERG